MSNIDRSFSFRNDNLITYLSEGDFERDIEDVIFYGDSRNADIDALFALIRRLDFMLTDYSSILAESMTPCATTNANAERVIYVSSHILAPHIVRVLRGESQQLPGGDYECVRELIQLLLTSSRELRMLVTSWFVDRISAESVIDETILLVVPRRVVS